MNHSTTDEPTDLAILCVDDEQVILTSVTAQLKAHFGRRYLYETALNGDEALEVLDELREDNVKTLIILSDWLMPGMRGDELLVRAHQRFPHTIKLILTGQADAEGIERARREANLYACLQKPWSREQLISTIERAIEALDQEGERSQAHETGAPR